MAEYILFGTSGCHLCEFAEQILLEADLDFELKEIMNDEVAQEKYSLLIPVLWHVRGERQLNWPFNAQQVLDFKG